MGKNKVIRYICFFVFGFFITMFVNLENVEALQCQYTFHNRFYDYEFVLAPMAQGSDLLEIKSFSRKIRNLDENPGAKDLILKQDSYPYVISSCDVYEYSSDENCKQNYTDYRSHVYYEYRFDIELDDYDVKLVNGGCPTVKVHQGRSRYVYYIYPDLKTCLQDHSILGCPYAFSEFASQNNIWTSNLDAVPGTPIYGEDDECPPEERQKYAEKESKYYAEYVTVPYEELKKYLDGVSMDSDMTEEEAQKLEDDIAKKVEDFEKSVKTYEEKNNKLIDEFNCILNVTSTRDTQMKSNMNVIEKIAKEKEEEANQIVNERARQTAQETFSNVQSETDRISEEFEEYVYEFENRVALSWTPTNADCGVLSDINDILDTVFGWVKILAPLLLIIFGTLDFVKPVISNDNEAIKKALNNFIKRALAAVAIFFLPLIIKLMVNLINDIPGREGDFENMLCGISKVVIR